MSRYLRQKPPVAAPFTSHVFDISCVPILIKEGRAALVTSFCCFKYMSLYSAIQFTSVSFLYASASNLGDFQFLFIDLALILPIAIFMGWTGAYPTLSRKRPTASLVSRKVLTPLMGQIVLCILVQLTAFETVQKQPFYQPPHLDKQKSSVDNSQNTALFLVSCYQYILSGIVLSIGPPFRQSMTANVPFVVTIVVTLLISLYMLLDPAQWLSYFMDLTEMSLNYELFLLVLAGIGFGVAYVAERYIFQVLAKYVARLKKILRAFFSEEAEAVQRNTRGDDALTSRSCTFNRRPENALNAPRVSVARAPCSNAESDSFPHLIPMVTSSS